MISKQRTRLSFSAVLLMALALILLGCFLQNLASIKIWFSKQIIRLREPIPVASLPQFTNANTVVILAMGQSNAASHGSPRRDAGPTCFAFHDGQFYAGADPWMGGSGFGGSVWSRFGRRVIDAKLSDYVVVACVAQGSTSVKEWAPGTNCFSNADSAIQHLQQKNLNVDCVIWHQGESDVIEVAAIRSEYRKPLDSVIQGIRKSGVNAPVLVCLASTYQESSAPEIRLAQLAVCSEQDTVFLGADTDDLGAPFRCDGVHFNDRGFALFADRLIHPLRHALTNQSTGPGEEKF